MAGFRRRLAGKGCGSRYAVVLCLASVLLAANSASAQTTSGSFPSGPLGERGRAVAGIFSAASPEARSAAGIEAVVAAHWSRAALAESPAVERAQRLAGALDDLGPAELVSVAPQGDNELRMVLHAAAKGLWLTLDMKLESAAPRGVAGVRLNLNSEPPAGGPRPGSPGNPPGASPAPAGPLLSQSEALARVAERVETLVAKEEFSGVVLLARDGKVLYERAAGFADREHSVANTASTLFNIGSIGKAFTQVAIAQLAAAGKLSPEDKLIRALPDYPDREIAEQVTLQQLLAHRSGLGDIFNERFTPEARASLRTLADHLPLFTGKPLEFSPGTGQRYSNAGYVVLGLVVERLSGQTFPDYVRDHIFAPAGMSGSTWLRRDALPAGAAVGYTRDGWQEGRAAAADGRPSPRPAPTVRPVIGPRRSNSGDLPAIGSSAGGSYSTARDLLAFDRALAANRLGGPERYAQQGGLGVAGGTVGANATLESDWESGWTIIVLANFDPPAAESLTRELRELLARLAPESANQANSASATRGSRRP